VGANAIAAVLSEHEDAGFGCEESKSVGDVDIVGYEWTSATFPHGASGFVGKGGEEATNDVADEEQDYTNRRRAESSRLEGLERVQRVCLDVYITLLDQRIT